MSYKHVRKTGEELPKADRVSIDKTDLGWKWGLVLLQVTYVNGARGILYLFLSLTPTLWSPQQWLMFALLLTEQSVYLDDGDWPSTDSPGRCKTWEEKQAAVSVPPTNVSGWYGPGAYLAWLLTAYVTAASSIWHSKCYKGNPESKVVDGEMLLTITYPLIAVCDVLLRLIQCRIDPGMTAAVFIIITAVMIIGPLTRLSVQVDNTDSLSDLWPQGKREWTWVGMRFTCHTVVFTTLGEPYGHTKLLIAVYTLLCVTMLYSHVSGMAHSKEYPYVWTVYRPRRERVVFFFAVQMIFMVVVLSLRYPFWPATGSRLWDLDQAAGLFVTALTLAYPRWKGIKRVLRRARRESLLGGEPDSLPS